MKKLHWIENSRSKCRPITTMSIETWDVAGTMADVTCKPCLKALGLTSTAMRTQAAEASCVMRLPDGKKSEPFKVVGFDLRAMNVKSVEKGTLIRTDDPLEIMVEMRLTEHGLAQIKQLLIKSV